MKSPSFGRQGFTRRRAFVRLAQQAGAATAAAGLGALVSILFDKSWAGPVIVTVVGVVLIAFTAWRITVMGHVNGTLYYVRHQFPGMADWHTAELRSLVKADPLDFRVLTREIVQPVVPDAAIDCADDIQELAIAFENQTNSDDASTGFSLAPDLQWFSALSFGAQIYARWDHQRLQELSDLRAGEGSGSGPLGSFAWSLREAPRRTYRNVRIEDQEFHDAGPDSVVLVSANLTTPNPNAERSDHLACRPTAWRLSRWYGVGDFPVGLVNWDTPYRDVQVGRGPGGNGSTELVDPWIATARCVQAIRRAAYENPDRAVLVSLAVPKTVAVAIGWHLMRDEIGARSETRDAPLSDELGVIPLYETKEGAVFRDVHPARANLWERLIPLYWGGRGFHPVRIHRAQPRLATIESRLRSCLHPRGSAPSAPRFPA